MQFDDFYETVGMFGPYQKVKYFLLCCTNMLPPVMVYAWTFIAATPSFQCQPPITDSIQSHLNHSFMPWTIPDASQCSVNQKHISLKECQRCFRFVNRTDHQNTMGHLMACDKFNFSRTYYESTIVEDWSMVCDRVSMKSTVQIVFFAGYMVGSLFFGILSDKYGRRPIMGVSFVLMFVAGIVCALAPQKFIGFETSYWLFVIGRFFVACATRGIAVTGFVIGSEIVGPKQRLFAGIVIKYFFAFGELLLLAIAYHIRRWRVLNAVLAVVPVPFIFFYFILPESPRWLVSKQRYDDAEILLRHIAEKNKKEFNSAKYQRFVQEDKKKATVDLGARGKVKAMFRSKVMAIIAINMSYQWFVQNIVFYGISQNTGAWLKNPYLSFGIAAFVEIAAYGVAHLTLDRVGRKIPYCSFVIALAFVALLVVPVQILIPKDHQTLMIIVNIVLKFLASGSYVIIYIYANETFPTQGRNTGMGVCSMIGRLGAIIGTFSNDHLTRLWVHFPIILYGVTSLFAVSLATIFPETLDEPLPQTIEDVERMGLACSFRTPNRKHPGHINGGHHLAEDDLLKEHLKDDTDS